jgi:hypothetical protein
MPQSLIVLIAMVAGLVAPPCMAGPETATPSCTVLMGTDGTGAKDADTNARWLALDSDLSHAVSGLLKQQGYRISDLIVYLPDRDKRGKALEDTVYKTRCHKVVQINFDLQSGTPDPKGAPQSGFVVSVSRLEQTIAPDGKSRTLKIIEEYNTEYEYIPERKKPTLDGLARSISDDLVKAGLLEK